MDWFLYDNGLRHERVKFKTGLLFSFDELSDDRKWNEYGAI